MAVYKHSGDYKQFSKLSVLKNDLNCNFVGLLHHPGLFWHFCGITFQLLKLLSLVKDH